MPADARVYVLGMSPCRKAVLILFTAHYSPEPAHGTPVQWTTSDTDGVPGRPLRYNQYPRAPLLILDGSD